LITQSAQGVLRTGLRMSNSPAAALTMLNQDLSERIDAGTFLTLLLLAIAQDGAVDVCNAGHHGPIVARGGEILTADKHGLALGFAAELEFEVDDHLALQSGDVLLAFTDGLIEAHSTTDREQLFGEERVKELLIEHARRGSSAEVITRALAEAAFEFAGGKPEDDITLVVIRKL
jgi:serine phosphatase RsbU (regulator of sigma subunit)